jgi:hypothetical protein
MDEDPLLAPAARVIMNWVRISPISRRIGRSWRSFLPLLDVRSSIIVGPFIDSTEHVAARFLGRALAALGLACDALSSLVFERRAARICAVVAGFID